MWRKPPAPFATRDRLIFGILLGTGIRLGSPVGLKRGDIDLQTGTLHILAKGGALEWVFLNSGLCAMLAAYLRENAAEAKRGPNPALRDGTFAVPLIRSKSGRRLGGRQVQLNFARWLRHAGIAPSILGPLVPPYVRHSAVPEYQGPVPRATIAGPPADDDDGDLRERSDEALRRALAGH